MKTGQYIRVICGNPMRGECTNIGVILFDEKGNQIANKFSGFKRAVHRGDLEDTDFELLSKHLSEIAKDVQSVERYQNTASHAMSEVQFSRAYPTRLGDDTLQRLALHLLVEERPA